MLCEEENVDWADRVTFFHRGRWGGTMSHENPVQNADLAKYHTFSVRNAKWRLTSRDFSKGEYELYYLPKDPLHKNNVAKSHPEIVDELIKAYDKWWLEVRPQMINEGLLEPEKHAFPIAYQEQLESDGISEWETPSF